MSDIFQDYSFGGWLRRLRVEKEITLREAASRLDMDPGNLSKLERSELAPPRTAKEIKRICKVLRISKHEEFLISLAYQHHLSELREKFGGFQ